MATFLCRETMQSVLITFGSFTLSFSVIGIQQSFGILYISLLEHFHESKSNTAWISSLANGVLFIFGPLAGIIGRKYGNHFTAMLGSLLSAIGLASSCFVESIHILYLTHGIITGLGFSFMFNSTNSIINLAFDKRRALAAGIATSGIGFGTICLPLLGSYFLKIYGWRGTFLLLSGITLHGFCSGMIFRLYRRKLAVVKSDGKESSKSDQEKKQSLCKLCLGILRSWKLQIFVFSGCLAMAVYFVPYLMLPDMVKGYGISKESGALMITVSGIFNIISRVVFGSISTLPSVNRLVLNGIALVIVGVATCCCFVIEEEYLFYIYTSLLGITLGVFGMLQSVILVDIVGKANVELSFGLVTFILGIAAITGPPFAGFITDRTGSYKKTFLYSGVVFIVSGLMSFFASYYDKCCMSSGKLSLQTKD